MAMLVKTGTLPDPTWENNLMSRFPPGADWAVEFDAKTGGFSARFNHRYATKQFKDWTEALLWVANRFGYSRDNAH